MASMKYHTPVLVEPPASLPLGFHKPSPPVAAMERESLSACGVRGQGGGKVPDAKNAHRSWIWENAPPLPPRGCTQVTAAVTAVFPATGCCNMAVAPATAQYDSTAPDVDLVARHAPCRCARKGDAHVSSLPHPLRTPANLAACTSCEPPTSILF